MQVCFVHPQTLEILETGCSHTVLHNDLQVIMILLLSQKKAPKKGTSWELTYAKLFNRILSHICTHTLEGRKWEFDYKNEIMVSQWNPYIVPSLEQCSSFVQPSLNSILVLWVSLDRILFFSCILWTNATPGLSPACADFTSRLWV